MDDRLYSIPEVAKMLNIKESTVATWLRSGKLNGNKLSKAWRVSKDDLRQAFPEFSFPDENAKVNNNESLESRLGYEPGNLWTSSHSKDKQNKEDCNVLIQEDLDRRFPFIYQGDQHSEIKELESKILFYSSRFNEESTKLEMLLAKPYKDEDKDRAETLRTFENTRLLHSGIRICEAERFYLWSNSITSLRENGEIDYSQARELSIKALSRTLGVDVPEAEKRLEEMRIQKGKEGQQG